MPRNASVPGNTSALQPVAMGKGSGSSGTVDAAAHEDAAGACTGQCVGAGEGLELGLPVGDPFSGSGGLSSHNSPRAAKPSPRRTTARSTCVAVAQRNCITAGKVAGRGTGRRGGRGDASGGKVRGEKGGKAWQSPSRSGSGGMEDDSVCVPGDTGVASGRVATGGKEQRVFPKSNSAAQRRYRERQKVKQMNLQQTLAQLQDHAKSVDGLRQAKRSLLVRCWRPSTSLNDVYRSYISVTHIRPLQSTGAQSKES